MLNVLAKPTDRKLRLLAVACCRHIWHLLTDERSRTVVEAAERYADGDINFDELRSKADEAWSGASFVMGRAGAAIEAAAECTWGKDGYGGQYHVALLTYHAFFTAGE